MNVNFKPRSDFGKVSAKRLREEGEVPCVISSKKFGSVHASLEKKIVEKMVQNPAFFATIVEAEIVVEGKPQKVKIIAVNVDFHPVNSSVLHIDFLHVTEKEVNVLVPVKIIGADKAPGLKKGGKLNLVKYHVPLKCKLESIPERVEINISTFGVGRSLFLSSITLPKGSEMAYDCLILSITGRGKKEKAEAEAEAVKTTASGKPETK